MKTKDLTYIEAVRALEEGKANAIKRPNFVKDKEGNQVTIIKSGFNLQWNDGRVLHQYMEHILANDWELVREPIRAEMKGTISFGIDGSDLYAGMFPVIEVLERKGFKGRMARIIVETID